MEGVKKICFVSGQSAQFVEMKLKFAKSQNRKVEIPVKQALLKPLKKKLKNDAYKFLGENAKYDDCGIDVDDILIVLDSETLRFLCVQMVVRETYNSDDANLKSSKDDFLPEKKSFAFSSDARTFKMSIYKNKSYYKGEEVKDENATTAGKAFYDQLSALLTEKVPNPTVFKKRLI